MLLYWLYNKSAPLPPEAYPTFRSPFRGLSLLPTIALEKDKPAEVDPPLEKPAEADSPLICKNHKKIR